MEVDQFINESGLNLPRVGQMGIITTGIREALPRFASIFNLRNWYKPKYAEQQYLIGGEQVELDFNIVFTYSGGLQIELIEEKSQKALFFKEHLEQFGQGLHHLAFFVPDIESKLKAAKRLGLGTIFEGEFNTAGGGLVRFAYLDTHPQCGTILELINVRLYGINIPQTEWMMNVGRLTKDVKKLRV
jgi:methylmalonyl-CoA/ethylmalonyl-CoA epimerase